MKHRTNTFERIFQDNIILKFFLIEEMPKPRANFLSCASESNVILRVQRLLLFR